MEIIGKDDDLSVRKPRVAISYHFFPHYRKGVIEQISRHTDAVFLGDSLGEDGIRPHNFKDGQKFKPSKCWRAWKFVFQPRTILEAFKDYDAFVFLANPNHISTWIAAILLRIRGRRVIFWGHGFKSSDKTIKNSLRKLFFSLSHAFYTYGWRAKKNAVALGFDPKKTYVGFNSLDYIEQKKIRDRLLSREKCSASREILITCISRLTTACRYDMLFDAIKAAQDNSPQRFRVSIIGDGPERAKLEQKARDMNIEAKFHGAIYDENKIAEHIYNADVTVSPGKVGLTAMHSLMYGTPVVSNDDFASQMPEVEAVIPGYTGELFKSGSIESLTNVLIEFTARFPDRELTRNNCFAMIDDIYNPFKQMNVLAMAIEGKPADHGDDAFNMFGSKL